MNKKSFTFVEIISVIGIIAFLASGIALVNFLRNRQVAEEALCFRNRRLIEGAEAQYFSQQGFHSQSLHDLVDADYFVKLPECPSGGIYAWVPYPAQSYSYQSVLGCSVHGVLEEDDFAEPVLEYSLWDPEENYPGGEIVYYEGSVFQARHYASAGDTPGSLNSPWQELTDQWRHFNVYQRGDIVYYNGSQFQTGSWSQNAQPGLISSPWQELTDQWRSFNIYTAGDLVWYQDNQYRAKWWTQNEAPGSHPVWELQE